MRNRTLGILGGALLAGGVILGIASIAADRLAERDAMQGPGLHRPDADGLPGHRAPGERGPGLGAPGRRLPNTTSPNQ
jgi:hypothetical protein